MPAARPGCGCWLQQQRGDGRSQGCHRSSYMRRPRWPAREAVRCLGQPSCGISDGRRSLAVISGARCWFWLHGTHRCAGASCVADRGADRQGAQARVGLLGNQLKQLGSGCPRLLHQLRAFIEHRGRFKGANSALAAFGQQTRADVRAVVFGSSGGFLSGVLRSAGAALRDAHTNGPSISLDRQADRRAGAGGPERVGE